MGQQSWLNQFDERQQKEIVFSKLYASQFSHGTEGHNAKLIIAKMAGLLEKIEELVNNPSLSDKEITGLILTELSKK